MKTWGKVLRRLLAAGLAGLTLWAFSVTMHTENARKALSSLQGEGESLAVGLLRWQLGDFAPSPLSFAARLALGQAPLLLGARQQVLALWQQADAPGSDPEENREGTLIEAEPSLPLQLPQLDLTDNGVTPRTLTPGAAEGYVVQGAVYVQNRSSCALSPEDLAAEYIPPAAKEGPRVLIIHTHGSEAYTLPPGQSYEASGDRRSLDCDYNMIRVGDEVAAVLAAAGISVLHDREIYDYPSYAEAYNRSYDAICRHRENYPSIDFVLDLHRDAVTDAQGTDYKLISATDLGNAAQLQFIMGSNGSGNSHDGWLRNLQLAAALQESLLADYPTLLRPIELRNARYNQHLSQGSLLLEVGAAGNSLDEALLSARLFAAALAELLTA